MVHSCVVVLFTPSDDVLRSVVSIGGNAFSTNLFSSAGLKSIVVPTSVTFIGPVMIVITRRLFFCIYYFF